MLFNNNLRPAMATVGAQGSASSERSNLKNIFVRSEQSADDDFNAFGNTAERTHASAPKAERPQRPQQPKGQRPPQRRKPARSFSWGPVFAVAGGVLAVILLVAILVAIFSAPGKNIKMEDDVYFTFVDAEGNYRIAANGDVLDEKFSDEINVLPAGDRSFAYVFEKYEGADASGFKMHIIKNGKLETIAATADSIKAIASYEPGIVYERNSRFHYYSEDDHTPITSDGSADNFVISGDAKVVVYTVNSSKESDQLSLKYFCNGASVSVGPYNFEPVAISIDGRYIYGLFRSALCYLEVEKEGETFTQNLIADSKTYGEFKGINGMNVDGNEIIFYTESETKGVISYMFSIKNKEPVQIAAGIFTPIYSDAAISCPSTFVNSYFECKTTIYDEDTNKTSTVVSTYFLDKKDGAQKIADTTGKFSPDGDYFYYVNEDFILVRVGLKGKDFKSNTQQIISDVADFSVIESGDVYIMFEDSKDVGYIYFWDSSTGKRETISHNADLDSMQVCANSIFFSETDDDDVTKVYISTGGSAMTEASFKSSDPAETPVITMGAGKKGYAYFIDEDGSTKLFFTSNGKKFSRVSDNCVIEDFNDETSAPQGTEAPSDNG